MKTAILLAIITIVLFAAGYETASLKRENNSQQQIIDSLQQEVYINNINLGRYEITLELLEEQDSIAADKFKNIHTNETE
jgi:SPX domain protein involved in polyphosphate accumulation